MELIFLYGPPGVGKLAVANELSRITKYPVFHNHIAIDLVKPLYPNKGGKSDEMILAVNLAAITVASDREKGMIFTYARPNDTSFIKRIIGIVSQSAGNVIFVQLKCDSKTLLRRMKSRKDSVYSKISDTTAMRKFEKIHGPFGMIKAKYGMSISTSRLSPKQAAVRIWSSIKKIRHQYLG